MEYTFEEFKKIKEKHNKDFDVKESLSCKDLDKTVNSIKTAMENNPGMEVFTLTRPIVTFESFTADLDLFNHIYKNHKDMIFTFLPETGYFAFFRTQEAKEKFDDNDLWRNNKMRDFCTLDLYTGGAELTRKDGTKKYIIFDKIKF